MHRLGKVLLLGYLIISISCSGKRQTRQKKITQEIPVVQVFMRDTFLQKRYVANIQAIRNVEIRNKVSGYLDNIYVDEGQEVKKGQLLFSINPEEYETEVAKAKAVLTNAVAASKEAEVQVERVKLLVDKDVISPTELDVMQAKLRAQQAKIDEARSSLINAQTNLSYTKVRAPFDGIIDRIPFKVGSLLEEGSLLTKASDVSSVYAYFNISEDEYLKYFRDKLKNDEASKKVWLNLADRTKYKYAGRIETMTSQFQEGTGSIALRAKFPNPNRLLRHGQSGEVVLSTRVNDVLLVPQRSVLEIQDKNYVYKVSTDNKVKMKSFIPMTRIADFYIVDSGLKAGDKIVYEGTQNLKDDMEIKPKPMDMISLMQSEQ